MGDYRMDRREFSQNKFERQDFMDKGKICPIMHGKPCVDSCAWWIGKGCLVPVMSYNIRQLVNANLQTESGFPVPSVPGEI